MTLTIRRLVVLALAVLMVAAVMVYASLYSEDSAIIESKAGGVVAVVAPPKAGGAT
jgi:hypothetical protein